MAAISDYALLGDTRTAALVARDGSLDWMCVPRFDSAACFAALLGNREHGRWLVAPDEAVRHVRRRYRRDSLVLETDFATASGSVRVTDCMAIDTPSPTVVRLVEGLAGTVPMLTDVVIRFDYGSIVPWVRSSYDGLRAVGGPDAVALRSRVPLVTQGSTAGARFTVAAGDSFGFVLSHHPSHLTPPAAAAPTELIDATHRWWVRWMSSCQATGQWSGHVRRSSIVLKALTYAATGGIVAAPTTSLPEMPGGPRNWDYRFSWLRDSTFTLYALMLSGFHDEARQWRRWMLRAAAGRPEDLQVLYGLSGERRLPETTLDWLPGYRDSRPVRIGNAAAQQVQLDVYGEVLDVLHLARRVDPPNTGGSDAWALQRDLLQFLESAWSREDRSLWEVRGPARHFTFSKVMAWVAFDRGAKAVQDHGLPGPGRRWRRLADTIHEQVCREGFDTDRGTFVQAYGSTAVDGALLMLPLVGFLPADDPRMVGTVARIERELVDNGLVRRYLPDKASDDGVHGREGAFLPCSFWLADNYVLQGRHDEAAALFERLLGLGNDVGLLAEECDPETGELLGNFPQALTHVALINTAHNLSAAGGPAHHRSSDVIGEDSTGLPG